MEYVLVRKQGFFVLAIRTPISNSFKYLPHLLLLLYKSTIAAAAAESWGNINEEEYVRTYVQDNL